MLGIEPLAADPRFATNGARVSNRGALTEILEARFAEEDGHDLTRGVREQVGRAWRYDLQNIADSDRAAGDGFWWNPLHGIDRMRDILLENTRRFADGLSITRADDHRRGSHARP